MLVVLKGSRAFRAAVVSAAGAFSVAGAFGVGALQVSPASAAIYLSLRPVASALPAGAYTLGSDIGGYTLTLPTKATQQTFQYDLVVHITQGTSLSETGARSLGSLFGAVRTSSAGAVSGGHVAYSGASSQVPTYASPAPAFQIDPTGQLQSSPQGINAGVIPGSLPGTAAPANYGTGVNGSTLNGQPAPAVLGVGQQSASFSNQFDNSIPQTAFQITFAFGGAQGFDPYTLAANTGVVVARATVNLTSDDFNGAASFNFVGGNGGNGAFADERWAQWFENGASFQSHNFNAAATNAVRQALNIQFDLVGDYNADGYVDAADYTVWADRFGLTGPISQPGDGNHDGVVDAADYTVWADNFGRGTPPGALPPGGAPAPVPEPAAASFLLAATVALAARRR